MRAGEARKRQRVGDVGSPSSNSGRRTGRRYLQGRMVKVGELRRCDVTRESAEDCRVGWSPTTMVYLELLRCTEVPTSAGDDCHSLFQLNFD